MKFHQQIPVLWSDEALLIVNKPPGLPTLPDGYNKETPFLVGNLKEIFGPLWVVHRLDMGTSGIVVFARTSIAHQALNQQFQERDVKKVYHAIVQGSPSWNTKRVDLALRPDGDRRHRTVIDMLKGKHSATRLEVIEIFTGYALIEAIPETGRTHQIRAHLAAVDLPIAGDKLYGARTSIQSPVIKDHSEIPEAGSQQAIIDRVALHALAMDFTHPLTKEKISVQAPYPDDFASTLQVLRGRFNS